MKSQRASLLRIELLRLLTIAALLLTFAPGNGASARTIYSFCPNFDCTTGSGARGSLLAGPKNSLYGVGYFGGANGGGVAFMLQRHGRSWTYQVLYDFCAAKKCTDGSVPSTPLIADAAGNLYGATQAGGANDGGAFFELSPPAEGETAWTETVLYSFCARAACADGKQPIYRLTYAGAAAGAPYDGVSPVYGVTIDGGNDPAGGVIYRLSPRKGGWLEKVLYAFCAGAGCGNGSAPSGGPTLDPAGNLYGVTFYGGASNYGVIYELAGSNYEVVHDFCEGCSEGGEPTGQLAIDAAGNLFGGAQVGGLCSAECGTLFKFAPSGAQYSVLYEFCRLRNCRDGMTPFGDLTMDASGNIYGATATRGGRCDGYDGEGAVYELSGSTYTRLHAFCRFGDGEFPNPGLTLDASGKLFGTTQQGGNYGSGTIFEISP